MRDVFGLTVGVLAFGLVFAGCAAPEGLPEPTNQRVEAQETVLTFDTDDDGKTDYWQYRQPHGRITAVAFAKAEANAPGPRLELDSVDAATVPHLIIALDGVPYDVVADLYRRGYFRLFHPPSRVVCCFPAMTDLALSQLFHTGPCVAYQALYYDRDRGRLSDGTAAYLRTDNSPWLDRVDYRCSFWWDGQAYLQPQAVFDHELRGIYDLFSGAERGQTLAAYSVGTAGLGTRGGRPAMEAYLRTIDRFCERLFFEHRGRVNITLLADHGHNLVRNERVSFTDTLEAAGFRVRTSLEAPGDVVTISYGLVTYASFYTKSPAAVARTLIQHEAVEFACYPADGAIVVTSRNGAARIGKRQAGFVYDRMAAESSHALGDPLQLHEILVDLDRRGAIAADGAIGADALFTATLEHIYPDPLRRIWEAFHTVAENPPDVIANLRDGSCHGSRFFHTMIGSVESTHGSLNRDNATTFALTTLGNLPPALRAADVLPALQERRGTRLESTPTPSR